MAGIDLVVTDLDGTLWDAEERIHERTLDAIKALEARGMPLLVATGRRPRGAEAGLARENLAPPAVLLDGAVGRDLATGETFHQVSFVREDALAVLEAFDALSLSPCVYVNRPDADVVISDRPSTSARHLEILGSWATRGDVRRVVETEDVLCIGLAGLDRATLEQVPPRIAASAEAAVTDDGYLGGATLMVRPRGVSKWEGVLAYCEQHGLDASRVLALGDGQNDLELLAGAAVACVVSDGCDEALALADHVIEPASAGGWCAVLELC